ncbi:DUF3593 domain-containing protein [Prosthecochloris sp. N3]|uniref:DUF3593 domain-containing protein n=1 Tax=Prosthecochloris ethylica TaxID=2743976 RepID=A0ABR9XS08_9CHLB|nr:MULTISPECIES: DUF3593 domain-containing protein [Prosthecochloris]MBF0586005.1 DUF3593 domain-containing protein [Prosthecochloris ethylica]MBF0636595.1 DUF3593 domain-containing protein [Prosthecochloris ethylica]NUK47227.1 DUF3593 domain-containing protein [Prosthecochloris ethylica]RNA64032.1 DUF3593 domain-containing protein [Prosthecochloris sp. ZM_2]
MLLSLPNWLIHISSSLEWGIAALLMYRYGKMIGRRDVERFGLFMIPHWVGSWFVLAYHISGDSVPILLDLSETVNLAGSISLLYATSRILKTTGNGKKGAETLMAAGGLFLISGRPQSFMGEDIFDAILQISSVVYLSFLVSLIMIRKRDPQLLSGLTVAGFWFVLVFISVTVFFMYLSTDVRGYQTLSHDDLMHGAAESLLTISNLMIVLGIHHQIKKAEQGLIQGSSSVR